MLLLRQIMVRMILPILESYPANIYNLLVINWMSTVLNPDPQLALVGNGKNRIYEFFMSFTEH